jgi:hypothetical protein
MTGVDPTVLLRIATTIATIAGKALVAGRRSAAERSMTLVELAGARNLGILPQRRLNRQLEQLAETIADRLQPIAEGELTAMPTNERMAALDAVAETLSGTDFTDDVLFKANLDESTLIDVAETTGREVLGRAALSEPAEVYFHRVLREAIAHLTEVIVTLPSFQQRTMRELLSREGEIIGLLREVVQRMPQQDTRRDQSAEAQFQVDYYREIVRKLDRVELFGVTLAGPSRRYPLSVAYIGLLLSDRTDEREVGVETLVGSHPRVYIRGEAGSGKTTLLRWLALNCARGTHSGPLTSWNRRTPIVVELRRFAERDLPKPSEFLNNVSVPLAERMPDRWVDDVLRSGRGVLLIDGVDEFPADRRDELHGWIGDLVNAYPQAQFVVTSRPAAAAADWLDELGFRRSELMPMTSPHIASFIRHWHDAIALGLDADDPTEAATYERAMVAAIERSRPLRLVATNPLLCALLCALNWDRHTQLPNRRIEIYRTALEMLLKRRDHERKVSHQIDIGLEYDDRLSILQDVAYWFTVNELVDAEAHRVRAKIATILDNMPHVKVPADAVYTYLLSRSGVLREPTPGRIDFIHKTFQEFLAAARFVEDDAIEMLIRNAHRDTYQQVIVMAAGCGRQHETDRIISSILDLAEKPKQAKARRARLRLLAISCSEVVTRISNPLYARVISHLKELTPPPTLASARVLAGLGEDVLDVLPDGNQTLTETEAAATIHTAALVGGPVALNIIGSFRDDTRRTVNRERIRAWSFFDPVEFARTAFGAPGASGWDISVSDPNVLPGVSHVPELASIRCHLDGPVPENVLEELTARDRLTTLTMRRNPVVSGMRFLTGADQLRVLELVDCHSLAELDLLSTFDRLESLHIGSRAANVTTDLLAPLKRLRRLAIHGSDVRLDGVLQRLRLTTLELESVHGLSSTEQLGPSETLSSLVLTDCEDLTTITNLGQFKLHDLTVSDSSFYLGSLIGVGEARDLRSLTFRNVENVNDFDFLSELSRLRRLEIVDCWITDLSPIRQLPHLQDVTLLDCDNIDDITVLLDLPDLRKLRINGIGSRLGPDANTFLGHLKARGVDVETDNLEHGPMWDDDLEDDIIDYIEPSEDDTDDFD